MPADSDNSARSPAVFGIECEALEGPTWGMGRQIQKLLERLSREPFAEGFRFVLYSNNPLPNDPLYDCPRFIRRPTGLKSCFGSWAPSSFSVYYYILLPLRMWRDRLAGDVRAVYHPNYMLPIGAPRRALVMLTDDIYRESRNPALPLRYRIAYRIYATGWAAMFAARIMAISRSSAVALTERGIDPSRIAVNELGVDPAAPGAAGPPTDFLFVGQAFPRRSLRESLLAFAVLAADNPSLSFRIIGADKYPAPVIGALVERINTKLGRPAVHWDADYVPADAVGAAYRGASSVVYVSETEGFGLPPLEGLSYGAVPIVADTPVNREIYGDGACFVAVPVTVERIAAALSASTDAAVRARILASGPSVTARYSWEAHAKRWLETMTSLA